MLKLSINKCDCSGGLAACMVPEDLIGQALCDFSNGPALGNSCIHLREDFGNHCDSADAQHEARHGSKEVAKPLTEEEVFDVVNPRTWPTY
jgi:hypothetical protein